MANIDLNAVDPMYMDVLGEIGNIGSGNATTALAQMLNRKIDMSVPRIALLEFSRVTDLVGAEEDIMRGILFGIR